MSMWWRSDRKVPVLAAMLLVIPIVLSMLPESWYSRMETIGAYEEDASAMGRINAWTMAYNIAKDRITGAGFVTAAPEIYAQYAPNPNFVIVAAQHLLPGPGRARVFWPGDISDDVADDLSHCRPRCKAGIRRCGPRMGGRARQHGEGEPSRLCRWRCLPQFGLLGHALLYDGGCGLLHAHVKSVVSRFPVSRLAANVG
ncbi:MAG: hypothetical protein IPH55_11900 [Betaproteobacteria bacterium]|nr:hypothetical protein [Betaproteobacteria bacterium]